MKKLLLATISLLALATPALAQNPTCPTRPAGDSSNACASTQFVNNNAGIPQVPVERFKGSCTSADNTKAINDAAASVTGAVAITINNPCHYAFTQANAINFTKPVFIKCTSPVATVLDYNPTADGTFLKWSNGLLVLYAAGGAGIDGCSIASADTTHNKRIVSYFDVSGFRFTNSSIGWPFGTVTGGSGEGSVCIYPHGREHTTINNAQLQCDTPIWLGMNPHAYLSTDHFHLSDLLLIPTVGDVAVRLDPGVVVTNTTLNGRQAWVGGTTGFYAPGGEAVNAVSAVVSGGSGYTAGQTLTVSGGTCSTPIQILVLSAPSGVIPTVGNVASIANPGVCTVVPTNPVSVTVGSATFTLDRVASFRLTIAGVRAEGETNAGHTFYINLPSLQGLKISDSVMDTASCGAFLAHTLGATIEDSSYPGNNGCGVAVSATSANGNDSLQYRNNFWGTGVTQDVTGLTPCGAIRSSTSGSATMPASVTYLVGAC